MTRESILEKAQKDLGDLLEYASCIFKSISRGDTARHAEDFRLLAYSLRRAADRFADYAAKIERGEEGKTDAD